jgi:hypothetical protein
MKRRFVFIAMLLVFSAGVMYWNIHVSAVSFKLDSLLSDMIIEFNNQIKENPSIMRSSNPYKFIENNSAYEGITRLGYEALPIINEKIEKSENNGLQEYILAIAAEQIASVDLKGESFNWDTGKGWAREWKKHLTKLPKEFELIMATVNSNDKVGKVIKLGAPAIPLIIEDIEKGNHELIPALKVLVQKNAKLDFNEEDEKDINKWIKTNKSKFEVLKKIVDEQQQVK